jgi:hypothetical protein
MAFPLGDLPTHGQKHALAGSTGAPDTGNEFLTKVEKAAASGLATLDGSTKVVQRLSYEAVNGGVATLDGSGKVVQHSSFEGLANGLATLDASGKVPLTQLPLAPVSPAQTTGFTTVATYATWICNTTGGTFTATIQLANSVPNGFIVRFVNTGTNALNVAVSGSDTLVANASSVAGSANHAAGFVSDGVSKWYQVSAV